MPTIIFLYVSVLFFILHPNVCSVNAQQKTIVKPPSSTNTAQIHSNAFSDSGHRIHGGKILDIKINFDIGLDAENYKRKNGWHWLEINNRGKIMKPVFISGTAIDASTNKLRNIMVMFFNRQELDKFVAQLNININNQSPWREGFAKGN